MGKMAASAVAAVAARRTDTDGNITDLQGCEIRYDAARRYVPHQHRVIGPAPAVIGQVMIHGGRSSSGR